MPRWLVQYRLGEPQEWGQKLGTWESERVEARTALGAANKVLKAIADEVVALNVHPAKLARSRSAR